MIGFGLESYLARERAEVEGALATVMADGEAGDSTVVRTLRHALDAGGKRLRPILCVASYRATAGEPGPAVYRLATALELIHTYSLIHDDLPSMDDDDVRRGRPAAHVAFGLAPATAASAALIPVAAAVAAAAATSLRPAAKRAIVVELCRAAGAGGMVGGQLMDLEAEGQGIELRQLEDIHRRKTGALLAAAPVIGGLAAGATRIQLDALALYGRALGLAFQIVDDILDVTGAERWPGSARGRDTELNKATFPALAGLEGARSRAAAEVESALAALDAADIRSLELEGLARYAVERDR